MKPNEETLGRFLKSARIRVGLGLRQVARNIGISAAHLSRIENNAMFPSGQLMLRLAQVYGLPIEQLTAKNKKPRASAAAHGHAMQASPELRALYRLVSQLDAEHIEDLIREMLRGRGIDESEIEKQLASLKAELPRVARNAKDGLFAAEAKPRFLTKARIEEMAYEKLRSYGIDEDNYKPPTPIELLVEEEKDLLYRVEPLKNDTRGNPLVLGLTGWDEHGTRQIVINSLLADSNRSSDEHRFFFTLAHELFHAFEHLGRVPKHIVAPLTRVQLCDAFLAESVDLKRQSPATRAVSKWADGKVGSRNLSTDEDWREWQANVFASAILMPKWAVRAEFRARFGDGPISVDGSENVRDFALWIASNCGDGLDGDRPSLMEVFRVSRQAMAIRLLGLGLVKGGEG
jgi:Zn-dependent peptidase ImmA (M78 family)/transcriptional regulator with XRE-family HTH domain